MRKFRKDHFNLFKDNVIKFQNMTNSIAAGKKQNIILMYKPMNIQKIDFKVTINVNDFFKRIQTIELTINGTVSEKHDRNSMNKFFKVDEDITRNDESSKLAPDLCYFSPDYLDLKNIRPFTRVDRLMFIHNVSNANPLQFCFEDYELSE